MANGPTPRVAVVGGFYDLDANAQLGQEVREYAKALGRALAEIGRHHRRCPCRPAGPGVAFLPRQAEHQGDGQSPVDQLAFRHRPRLHPWRRQGRFYTDRRAVAVPSDQPALRAHLDHRHHQPRLRRMAERLL